MYLATHTSIKGGHDLEKNKGFMGGVGGKKGKQRKWGNYVKISKTTKNGVKAPGLSHTYLSRASYICHLTSKKLVSILCNLSGKS